MSKKTTLRLAQLTGSLDGSPDFEFSTDGDSTAGEKKKYLKFDTTNNDLVLGDGTGTNHVDIQMAGKIHRLLCNIPTVVVHTQLFFQIHHLMIIHLPLQLEIRS